jgi:predicted metal-dependent hydrolase
MGQNSYDPRYVQGAEYFNKRAFFDAHEIWEDMWRDDDSASKDFYKGLIQVAVCLHHFGNGNTRGARKLFLSSRRYLSEYGPRHVGVDIEKLLAEMQLCCAELIRSEEDVPRVKLPEDRIPKIHLDPPAADAAKP